MHAPSSTTAILIAFKGISTLLLKCFCHRVLKELVATQEPRVAVVLPVNKDLKELLDNQAKLENRDLTDPKGNVDLLSVYTTVY